MKDTTNVFSFCSLPPVLESSCGCDLIHIFSAKSAFNVGKVEALGSPQEMHVTGLPGDSFTGKFEDRIFDCPIGEIFNTLCTDSKSGSILGMLKQCQACDISKDNSFIA